MAGTLHCVITSPEGLVYEGNARSIVVPAADGEMGILPRHAPIVGALGYGEVRIEPSGDGVGGAGGAGGETRFFLEGGFLQVLGSEVTLLATEAEPVASITRASAEERLKALLAKAPPKGSPIGELDLHQERIRVARRRVKLAV